jgi:hypothetical protein
VEKLEKVVIFPVEVALVEANKSAIELACKGHNVVPYQGYIFYSVGTRYG